MAQRSAFAPDFTISRVLTGLWQIADMERDGKTVDVTAALASMRRYAEAGFTTFDMADHYGSAEEIAGEYRARRAGPPIEICTKWVPTPGPVTRDDVRAAVTRALRRTQSEVIDLLQFHCWKYSDPSWLDALFFLNDLRREGLIRQLGVTNFDAAHVRVAVQSGIPIVSNQVSFSILDRRAAGRLRATCEELGVRLLAYGTLAGGFLSERWLGRPEPSGEDFGTWSQMKYRRFIDAAGGWDAYQRVLSIIDRVARRLGASIANVASRYVLEEPHVAGVIVGARLGERDHVDDNLKIFSLVLDDESRGEINAAIESLQPVPGDCGDEYRKPPYLTASGDLSHHLESFPAPYAVHGDSSGRQRAMSGTSWETFAGYSRAVRVGDRILVSGTTASHGDQLIGGRDPVAQTHFVIDKITGAIESLGGRLEDVVRTRVFVADVSEWEGIARAHGERFAGIQPANTLVQAALIGTEFRVEIEAEAIVR